MGNGLDVQKIISNIIELSENNDLNIKFLLNQFNNLIELCGGLNINYNDIYIVFKELICKENIENFNDNNLEFFVQNLLEYFEMEKEKNYGLIKPILTILCVIMDNIYEKFNGNLNKFLANNLKKINNTTYQELKKLFPFNILIFCINNIINLETINKNIPQNLKFLTLLYNFIIFHRILLDRNANQENKYKIECLDVYKFLLCQENFISKENLNKFINNILLIFFGNFSSLMDNKSINNYQKFTNIVLSIILYFLEDTNKYFIQNIKLNEENKNKFILFSNEDNNNLFEFLKKIDENINNSSIIIIDYIKNYSIYYNEIFINIFNENGRILNEFFVKVFSNLEDLTYEFKSKIFYFILKIFDIFPNILEISYINDFIETILINLVNNKIRFSFSVLILINKFLTNKMFLKIFSEQQYNNNELLNHIENFFDIIVNFISDIKNDYSEDKNLKYSFSLIILYNLSFYIKKLNKIDSFEKLSNEIFLFLSIDSSILNFQSKFVIFKLFLDIINNLLKTMDEFSSLLLILIKNYEILNLNYKNIYNYFNSGNNINILNEKIFNEFKESMNNINEILEKIINKLNEEGMNWKFSTEKEIIKIINKVLFIPKDNDKKFKDITISNTNVEINLLFDNIVNNIYDINNMKILKNY